VSNLYGFVLIDGIKTWLDTLEYARKDDRSLDQTSIDLSTLVKINVISRDDDYSFVHKIGNFSVFGLVNTIERFANPQADIATLQQEQALVKELVDNGRALEQLAQAFALVKEGQGKLLSYYAPVSKEEKEAIDNLYSGPSFVKNTKTGLYVFNGLKAAMNAYGACPWVAIPVIGALTGGAISVYSAPTIQDKITGFFKPFGKLPKQVVVGQIAAHYPWEHRTSSETNTWLDMLDKNKEIPTMGDGIAEALRGMQMQAEMQARVTGQKIEPGVGSFAIPATIVGVTAFMDILYLYMSRSTIKRMAFENTLYEYIHARLHGVAQIVEGLKQIKSCANSMQQPVLNQAVEAIDQCLATIQPLASQLDCGTFKGTYSSITSSGVNILYTHRLMENQAYLEAFIKALQALGTIERLVVAADAYQKCVKTQPASFTEFLSGQEPQLVLRDFYHPMLLGKSAITNTLTLGLGGDCHVCLTGNNGGGKTTVAQGALFDALMAQVLTWNCASFSQQTPFDFFHIFLDETGSIVTGQSSFVAQEAKLKAIVQAIQTTSPDKRSLTFIDEPLKGSTVEGSADNLVFNGLLSVAEQSNNIILMTTHSKKLTQLHEATGGRFVNYSVLIDKETMKRLYLIGPFDPSWFDDAELRNRFIEALTQGRA